MFLWLLFGAVMSFVVFDIVRKTHRKPEPHEVEWGSGKDLSALDIHDPINALEKWWEENESKNAEIARLAALVKQKVKRIDSLLEELQRAQRPIQLMGKDMSYFEPNRPTTAVIKFQGMLADVIHNGANVDLTIRDGQVVNWNISNNGMAQRELDRLLATPITSPYRKPKKDATGYFIDDEWEV